jgi:molecular chaperone HscB
MDIADSHFVLFHLPERFALDPQALEAAFLRVQSEVHPDRFAAAGIAAKRIALQWATRANEAYSTLKDPLKRAQYLCELHGIDLEVESNTAMPADFLMEQLEWREALEDAEREKNVPALESLDQDLGVAFKKEVTQITQSIDGEHDFAGAARSVRRLMFLDKTRDDVNRALDALTL